MKPIVHPANDAPFDAGVVFAVHASSLAILAGELSVLCLQRDQPREEALFHFGRGWLRKNWESHVAPVFHEADKLRDMCRREPAASIYPAMVQLLFVACLEEYDPDSSSRFVRAMRLDDARKFAMVRKVMTLKPWLSYSRMKATFEAARADFYWQQIALERLFAELPLSGGVNPPAGPGGDFFWAVAPIGPPLYPSTLTFVLLKTLRPEKDPEFPTTTK